MKKIILLTTALNWPGKTNTVNIREDGIKQVFLQDIDGYWIKVTA